MTKQEELDEVVKLLEASIQLIQSGLEGARKAQLQLAMKFADYTSKTKNEKAEAPET